MKILPPVSDHEVFLMFMKKLDDQRNINRKQMQDLIDRYSKLIYYHKNKKARKEQLYQIYVELENL